MSHYHKERDAFIEHQNRCTRNMSPHDPYKDAFKVTWPTEERINNIGQNGPTGEHYMNKYQRKLTSPIIKEMDGGLTDMELEVFIDVYHVLDAYPSGCPPIDHAIKKLLCTGSRGAKDWETDLQEAIDSLERAKSFPPLPF
jgi:hypothetical protein